VVAATAAQIRLGDSGSARQRRPVENFLQQQQQEEQEKVATETGKATEKGKARKGGAWRSPEEKESEEAPPTRTRLDLRRTEARKHLPFHEFPLIFRTLNGPRTIRCKRN